MKIKLTKQQSIIIITITTLLLIIGLCFIFKITSKPTKQPSITNYQSPNPTKTFDYDDSQTYEQNLERWKNQCVFKPGTYNSSEIITKIGDNLPIKFYCLDEKYIQNITTPYLNEYIHITKNSNELVYYSITCVENNKRLRKFVFQHIYNNTFLCVGSSLYQVQIQFNTYVDTTPPPKKSDYGL